MKYPSKCLTDFWFNNSSLFVRSTEASTAPATNIEEPLDTSVNNNDKVEELTNEVEPTPLE
jgi:hypothetical protein